jgi:aldose 1-epimerase
VAEATPRHAVLRFDYAPGDWPWAYACEQRVELSDDGALFSLELRNVSNAPMPASFGFHPYFPRRRGTRLQSDVAGMWEIDATTLPVKLAAPIVELGGGASLAEAPFIDHCFTEWRREAHIVSHEAAITMTASEELSLLHIFAPHSDDFFCVEPVSAMPDAVNRTAVEGNGLRVLAPGAAVTGWMRIVALAH